MVTSSAVVRAACWAVCSAGSLAALTVERMVDSVPYDWVWMDRVWLPEGNSGWMSDGAFHWYAYQWHTNATVKRFYGLIV